MYWGTPSGSSKATFCFRLTARCLLELVSLSRLQRDSWVCQAPACSLESEKPVPAWETWDIVSRQMKISLLTATQDIIGSNMLLIAKKAGNTNWGVPRNHREKARECNITHPLAVSSWPYPQLDKSDKILQHLLSLHHQTDF